MQFLTRQSYAWKSDCTQSPKDFYDKVFDLVSDIEGFAEHKKLGSDASGDIQERYSDVNTNLPDIDKGLTAFMVIVVLYYLFWLAILITYCNYGKISAKWILRLADTKNYCIKVEPVIIALVLGCIVATLAMVSPLPKHDLSVYGLSKLLSAADMQKCTQSSLSINKGTL